MRCEFDVRGDGNPNVNINAYGEDAYGLFLFDNNIPASASLEDSKLHTRNASTGNRIHTIDVGVLQWETQVDRVNALAGPQWRETG